MKKSLIAILCSISIGSVTLPVEAGNNISADPSSNTSTGTDENTHMFKVAREKLKNMTPEQRNAFRKEIKAKWEKLSPQEQQAFIDKAKVAISQMRKNSEEKYAHERKHHGEGFVLRAYALDQLEGKSTQ